MNLEVHGNAKDGYFGSGESDGEYLEPCPFCGSLNVTVSNTHTPSYWAECEDCGAQGPSSTYPKREARSRAGVRRQHKAALSEAVERWNRRM